MKGKTQRESNNSNKSFMNKNKNKDKINLSKSKALRNENKINKIKKPDNYSIKPETDYEFNWLSYEDALKFDKRSSGEYYCSLIRIKQLPYVT